jgi:hypothetical protein
MKSKYAPILFAIALSFTFFTGISKAEDNNRAKMAEMHQMMADCLKSVKPIAECKKEMMSNCPMMKETGRCPMMGEMDEMMGHHSKHRNMDPKPKK